MTPTALITGASSGIGYELACIHARQGDNLVLVARNKKKLDELKSELENTYAVKVHTIGKDLAAKDAAIEVFNELKAQNIQIDYLINNAGFGHYGLFAENDWTKEEQMIALNITALTQFTKLFLPGMIARKKGRIMNVASVAAFIPGPLMAVYYATKAYVLSFSQAIGNEVRNHGITVTALCPGPTTSGFQAAAEIDGIALFESGKLPTSAQVAEYGYKAMMKGKSVAIHGISNRVMTTATRFIPRSLIVKAVRKVQDKK